MAVVDDDDDDGDSSGKGKVKGRTDIQSASFRAPGARSRRGFTVTALLMLATLALDYTIGSFYDVMRGEVASPAGVLLFAAIAAVLYGSTQYILIGFARQASSGLRSRSASFDAAYIATIVVQGVVMAILVLITVQMAAGSHYDTRLLVAGMAASTLPAAGLLGWFSYRFFLWYRSNRKHVMILVLGCAEAVTALAAAGNVISMSDMLLSPEGALQVGPQPLLAYHELLPELRVPFFLAVVFPIVLSLVLRWLGTVLVVRNFSRRIDRALFWTIVCVPLALLMGVIYSVLLDPLASHLTLYDTSMLASRIVGFSGGTVSFLLMGIAYYAVARSISRIDRRSAVIDYMLIAAYGVVMLPYALSAPVIIYVAYPPFGALAHFTLTAASYLLSLGIYSSAISVSQDMSLRRSIKKQALGQQGLLDSIGAAGMEDEVVRRVAMLVKKSSEEMEEETGIQPSSITEAEIRQYLELVINELKADSGKAGHEAA